MNWLSKAKQMAVNLPGWRTNRKIVVIESDDWGTIRTSSKAALSALKRENIRVNDCHYMLNDTLEGRNDLEELFNILLNHVDSKGNPACVTGNCLVANPNFQAIKQSGFEYYEYENLHKTFSKYSKGDDILSLWHEGNNNKVFNPQFHGREHLNVSRWMASLQANDPITTLAFNYNMFGISGHILPQKRGSFLAAFDQIDQRFPIDQSSIVRDGLGMFRDMMGYFSRTIIAPNYVWDAGIEEAARKEGVYAFQGTVSQRLPSGPGQKVKVKRHYLGQKRKNGLRYLVRNAHFEPASNLNKDWVNSCLREISIAFQMRKPAIISSHRVNFVGGLEPVNRVRGLRELNKLLTEIRKQWPDVEFISTDHLIKLIEESSKS